MNSIFILLSLTVKLCSSRICGICQYIVTEFEIRLKNSDNDNSVRKESLHGAYKSSKIRLYRIIDSMCLSSTHNLQQCEFIRNAFEGKIEQWWMKVYSKVGHKRQGPKGRGGESLYGFMCVNILQVCCHNNYYGEKCERCKEWSTEEEGGVLCGGHGYCNGNGTRGGDGTCVCLEGYRGVACGECADNYYNNSNEGGGCASCGIGCSGGCRGPHSCVLCKEGYQKVLNNVDSGSGSDSGRCEDVNECSADSQLCRGEGQRCRNTEGGYTCDCDDNYDKVEKDGSCKLKIETTEI